MNLQDKVNEMHIRLLAARLAEKHREPNEVVPHPKVVVKLGDGSVDEHMMKKLSDDKYVPYCSGSECGRTRRKPWGFQCPTCGNKTNWDLTHYNGNLNVEYVDGPPVLSVKDWNEQVEARKIARREARKLKAIHAGVL